jgi:hypothetical protein
MESYSICLFVTSLFYSKCLYFSMCQNFYIFKAEWYSIVCMYHILFIPPSLDDTSSSTFWLLWIMWLWTPLCKDLLSSSWCRVRMLHHVSTMFNFLRNDHAVFHRGTILHPHQWCTRVLACSHPCQHYFLCILWCWESNPGLHGC